MAYLVALGAIGVYAAAALVPRYRRKAADVLRDPLLWRWGTTLAGCALACRWEVAAPAPPLSAEPLERDKALPSLALFGWCRDALPCEPATAVRALPPVDDPLAVDPEAAPDPPEPSPPSPDELR